MASQDPVKRIKITPEQKEDLTRLKEGLVGALELAQKWDTDQTWLQRRKQNLNQARSAFLLEHSQYNADHPKMMKLVVGDTPLSSQMMEAWYRKMRLAILTGDTSRKSKHAKEYSQVGARTFLSNHLRNPTTRLQR